jgi:hypothetical protein
LRSLQELGKPHEAAGDVRDLLDLMHDNGDQVREWKTMCVEILDNARSMLNILGQDGGDKELINAVVSLRGDVV